MFHFGLWNQIFFVVKQILAVIISNSLKFIPNTGTYHKNVFFLNILTCSASLVERSQMLSWSVSWNEISQSNGGQRNKAIVKGIQIVPIVLQTGENGRRDQKETTDDNHYQLNKELYESIVIYEGQKVNCSPK